MSAWYTSGGGRERVARHSLGWQGEADTKEKENEAGGGLMFSHLNERDHLFERPDNTFTLRAFIFSVCFVASSLVDFSTPTLLHVKGGSG